MEVAYSAKALEDIGYWKKAGNKKIQQKIAALIEDIKSHPFSGIGKPEPLKHELAGKWSRRIDKENRIIYTPKENTLYIYSLKGHY
jgi:toxin YoeB